KPVDSATRHHVVADPSISSFILPPSSFREEGSMIPGEYFFDGDPIELNAGRPTATLEVNNTGDRPVQVGSHYHFFEVNRALVFDRKAAYGMRLDLPAGTAVRF